MMNAGRDFYEKKFHFDEDVCIGIDEKRLQNFFKEVKFNETNKYLDIGCGVGWALNYVSSKGIKGKKYIGFDISKKAISLAEKNLNPEIIVLVADGENLPFPDSYFNSVFSLGTIEHFPTPARGLEEIQRVTEKNGQVLLVVPNSYWILNKLKIYKGTEQPQEMLATLGEWGRLFQKYRLKVKKIRKDVGPKILKNKKLLGIIKRLLLKFTIILPTLFAYQFIFICKKI